MASNLPRFVVFKSVLSGRYAYYMTETEEQEGYVRCEENVYSPYAKIEVEVAKINSKYVHLRFCHNNKYWARRGPSSIKSDQWIVASSKQPEEDKSKWSCTMFELSIWSGGALYLRHVQSGKRLRTNTKSESGNSLETSRLWVDDSDSGVGGDLYRFDFVDWDTLVIMPQHVAFKGNNDKYLKAYWNGSHEYMQLSSEDGNEEAAAHEIIMNPDGYLRIKSKYFGGKFWRRSPNWIWADSTDAVGKDIDTLFWPVKVDDSTIALRNAGNNNFCKPLTMDRKTDCLNAAATTITNETKLKVEELVLERSIYNVKYHMDDARIFDESVFVAGTGAAANNSDSEATLIVRVAYEDVTSYSFNYNLSIMAGIKTTFTTGIPKIAEGKIEVSAEVTNSFDWNTVTTITKTQEAAYEAVVPPKSTVRVNYVATRGKCNIPFSYTRRDKRANDGSIVTSQHVDGIYTGVNYYSLHFEQVGLESL